jgi:peptide/nickel transport system ATP-binding protein
MSGLVVEDLSVTFRGAGRPAYAVSGLSYELHAGRTLGIVGESGCGKSASALAVLGLHDPRRADVSGSIRVSGTEVVGAPAERVRALRGSTAAMVFQNPQSSLHPMKTIGAQIAEAYRVHHPRTSRAAALARTVDILDRVGIAGAARRVRDYPHEFSGGMRQRAMIAMALINDPTFLIADEPTTALDVTVQAQILDLLDELKEERGLGIVLITHDLGVISSVADDVLVMYAGRGVEYGPTRDVLANPRMPYTAGLLASLPSGAEPDAPLPAIPGSPPDPARLPIGCAFHPRCPHVHAVPDGLCRSALP